MNEERYTAVKAKTDADMNHSYSSILFRIQRSALAGNYSLTFSEKEIKQHLPQLTEDGYQCFKHDNSEFYTVSWGAFEDINPKALYWIKKGGTLWAK